MSELRQKYLKNAKKVVVKVGSRLLVDSESNCIRTKFVTKLAASIAKIQESGKQVVLVSSGAVGAGMAALNLAKRPKSMGKVQACASVGQLKLMHHYEAAFKKKNMQVGQVLVSADDFRSRKRYSNICSTVDSLLKLGVVPIINENDSVAIEEIKVGDNDKLSADVTQFLDADLLMIFTDEDGLYNKNPKEHSDAVLVNLVHKVNQDIFALAGDKKGSEISTGGMQTKLEAIQQATQTGCMAILANGFNHLPHDVLLGKDIGTLFLASSKKVSSRNKWISRVSTPKGKVILDEGASLAIGTRNASLLAVGVTKVIGDFSRGDFVEILGPRRQKIARGLINYRTSEVQSLLGKSTQEIEKIMGKKAPKELVHRNNLVVL